ncbi:MAG: helix-turn-helix domain-containing protein, partial [Clostridia bacterium]
EERKIMKLGSNKEMPIDIRIISSTNESPSDAIRKGHMREDLFYRLSVVQIVIPPLRERKEDIPLLVRYFIEKYNKRFNKHIPGVDAQVMSVFTDFSWPGNVRQLKACIESSMNFVADGDWISMKDLPAYLFEDAEVPENRYRQWMQKRDQKTRQRTKDEKSPAEESTDGTENEILSDTAPVFGSGKTIGDEETYGDIMEEISRAEKEEIIAALREYRGNITKAAASLGMSRQSLSYRMKKYRLR